MTRAKDISKILTDADISGNIDVDGVTNLDNTDIDGTLNVQGETTLQTHLNMGDEDKIKLGASGDLEIYHDGNNSFIKDTGTGSLYLQASDSVFITNASGNENKARFDTDGAVTLYHNNAAKIATTSTGVTVTGLVKTSNAYQVWLGANVLGSTGGLTSIGANPIVIGTDGTERMRLNSSGDVGINTSSTPSASSAGSRFLTVAGSTDGILQLTKNGSGGGALASANGVGMIFYSHTGTVGSETYTERGRIHSDGAVTFNQRVSINSSTKPSSAYGMRLQIASGTGGMIIQKVSTALNYAINFLKTDGASIGTITLTETATAFNTSSDYRLKENVDYTFDATTRLKQLKPCRFNFIADADKTVDGFLAHEVSSVVPEAITGEKDAMTAEVLYVDGDEIPDGKKIGDVKEASEINPQSIDQSKLTPLLVKTIQELEARITTLEGN